MDRRSFIAGTRDVGPILVGVVPFALVAGAAVTDAGLSVLESVGCSVIVFAGAAQLALTQLWGDGAPLFVIIATALVINARFIMYSASIAPVLAPEAGKARPFLGYLLTDQAYAVTIMRGREDGMSPVPYYVGAGFALWATWQAGTLVGALVGAVIPVSWQLDFAVPLVFLSLLVPALKVRADVEVALVSGVTAALLVPVMPLRSGLLVAILCGAAWGAWRAVGETLAHSAVGDGPLTAEEGAAE